MGRNRYERRSQARARRVQRRLEQVQRERGTRSRPPSLQGQLGAKPRATSRGKRAAIFAASLIVGIFLAQAVTATVVEWWNDEPLAVAKVAVLGTDRLTSEDVAWATGLEKGSRVETLSEPELAEKVAAHPWIHEARVALLPTGTVIIDVDERIPAAVLRSPSGDYFVDSTGVAFAAVAPSEVPAAGGMLLMLGRAGDSADVRDGLAIGDRLAKMALPAFEDGGAPHRGLELVLPSEAAEPREGWVLRRAGGTKVILGSDDVATVGDRLDRLARLLEAGIDVTAETTTIDLRFAGQAVLRKE